MIDQRRRDDPRGALARRHFAQLRARIDEALDVSGHSIAGRVGYIIGGVAVAVGLYLTGHNIDKIAGVVDRLDEQQQAADVLDARQDAANLRGCRRTNVAFAVGQLRSKRDRRVLPILDCESALLRIDREGVPLAAVQARVYVCLIGKRRLPITKRGIITDSVPFPRAGPDGRIYPERENPAPVPCASFRPPGADQYEARQRARSERIRQRRLARRRAAAQKDGRGDAGGGRDGRGDQGGGDNDGGGGGGTPPGGGGGQPPGTPTPPGTPPVAPPTLPPVTPPSLPPGNPPGLPPLPNLPDLCVPVVDICLPALAA